VNSSSIPNVEKDDEGDELADIAWPELQSIAAGFRFFPSNTSRYVRFGICNGSITAMTPVFQTLSEIFPP
jgi:hypothetical protein